MPRTPQILIVSPDARLRAEVAAALQGIADLAPVLHHAADLRQGVEAARSRRPEFILVEMTSDPRALRDFAEEVLTVAPETSLAAVYRPDLFGPDVPESALLIEALRAGLQDFLRRPVSRAEVEQLLERRYRKVSAQPGVRQGKIESWVSNKGGVGKSTLCVNVGCALARRHPDQVLVIDASLQMGVCASLLDLRPPTTLFDAAQERDRLDETLLRQLAVPHACGLHLLAAPADAVEAAQVDDETMSRILTLARRAYDFVLVDTFPMLDRVMMAVLDLSDRVNLVLEAVVPTVLGAARLLHVLDALGYPRERQRLLLNRYTGGRDNLRPADVAERLGRDIDHVLPSERRLTVAANLGRPHVLGALGWWGFARAVRDLARAAEQVTPEPQLARGEPPTAGSRGIASFGKVGQRE